MKRGKGKNFLLWCLLRRFSHIRRFPGGEGCEHPILALGEKGIFLYEASHSQGELSDWRRTEPRPGVSNGIKVRPFQRGRGKMVEYVTCVWNK